MEDFLSIATIPILMFIVLMYYAFRLVVLKDVHCIRGVKNAKKLQNEEEYAREAGALMIFLAIGSLVMIGILYFNTAAAVAVIVAWIVVFGILWRRMDDQYGQ